MAQPTNTIPIEHLHLLFECDFETGSIFHKIGSRSVRPGSVAGAINSDGYLRIKHAGKSYSAHRVIWAMFYGAWPENVLDHIDCNRSNNAIKNLRLAEPTWNAANRRKYTGSSALKGVSWNKSVGKWQSQVRHKNKDYYLGLFSDEHEAHQAYAKKAKELFGDFARLK